MMKMYIINTIIQINNKKKLKKIYPPVNLVGKNKANHHQLIFISNNSIDRRLQNHHLKREINFKI